MILRIRIDNMSCGLNAFWEDSSVHSQWLIHVFIKSFLFREHVQCSHFLSLKHCRKKITSNMDF